MNNSNFSLEVFLSIAKKHQPWFSVSTQNYLPTDEMLSRVGCNLKQA